ncbi:MAG: signal peptide peptidase SppA [Phycisphaerales bacterium]
MRVRAVLIGVVVLALAGCLPDRIVLDLKPDEGVLEETLVMVGPSGRDGPKVALIDVRGLIADASAPGLVGSGSNPVDEFVARLAKAADDHEVRAVVVRINSPGGTVTGSDAMYRELARFRERTGKPVVACLSEVAASGGYYLALGADEIVAAPTTITGSVGVIMQTVNVSRGLSMIGVEARSVTSGPNKALASPLEPAQEEHYAILQGMVDEFYGRFRGLVRERRSGVSGDDLARCTDGRVVTGMEAARVGMVDGVGDIHDAVARAMERAGLTRARVVKYHGRGASVRTAYARGGEDEGAFSVRVSGEGLGVLPAGFYYLWRP